MQVYLVGGAVRDKLLGFPVIEHDWVVVGATPEGLFEQGFRPVGKDFPVFLHPETQEEYALARTERKTAPGYTGFQFHTDPDVTLEQDLLRRDLTINAMAEDHDGTIIDPYNGLSDLNHRILRHVSPAFSEDPVRILRVARFAARYHHLGFTLAPETLALMQSMVSAGEVDSLVAERVWKECQRALAERHPEVFFQMLRDCHALARIMPELDALFGVPQRPDHHPEIDCGIHSLMSLQQACLLTNDTEVRFASLIHDLGKALTPADILPRHLMHEVRSVPLVKRLCERLAAPKSYRDLATHLARDHTHIHRALELRPGTILDLMQRVDAFRRPAIFEQVLLGAEADARGRTGFEKRDYPQADFLRGMFTAASSVSSQLIIAAGHTGAAIGEQLRQQRLQVITQRKTMRSDQ